MNLFKDTHLFSFVVFNVVILLLALLHPGILGTLDVFLVLFANAIFLVETKMREYHKEQEVEVLLKKERQKTTKRLLNLDDLK